MSLSVCDAYAQELSDKRVQCNQLQQLLVEANDRAAADAARISDLQATITALQAQSAVQQKSISGEDVLSLPCPPAVVFTMLYSGCMR